MTELSRSFLDEVSVALFAGLPINFTEAVSGGSLIPFVEWSWLRASGTGLPPVEATGALARLQAATRTPASRWTDELTPRIGFCRVRRATLDIENLEWVAFLMSFRRAAEASGLTKELATQLTGVLKEMEENIHLHAGNARSGLIAFQSTDPGFEFVVVDRGRGVLSTLSESPEFCDLSDHGDALRAAIHTGNSRYGLGSQHGQGFNGMVAMTSNAQASVQLRTGDALLQLDASAGATTARTFQRAMGKGFLIGIRLD